MIQVPITVNETFNIDKVLEPVSMSIPFANGDVFNTKQLRLVTPDNKPILCQITALTFWPNKSVKWARLYFQYSLTKLKSETLTLISTDNELSPFPELLNTTSIAVKAHNNIIQINTGSAIFNVNTRELGAISHDNKPNNIFSTKDKTIVLTTNNDERFYPYINNFSIVEGEQQTTIRLSGSFKNNDDASGVNFETSMVFYLNKSYCKHHIALHNPKPMVHHGGKWDLGNDNSLYFKSFNIVINTKDDHNLEYTLNSTDTKHIQNWHTEPNNHIEICQLSSGGNNWKSGNHVDKNNQSTVEINGYQINNELPVIGRASPTVHLQSKDKNKEENNNLTVHIDNFWQKFPKSIAVEKNIITLGLFPQQARHGFELQPGEKKSDHYFIDFSNKKENLLHFQCPIQISVCPQYIAKTQTVTFFTPNEESDYNDIINDGLNAQNNFFQKRELIDEYGWRNFGDLYADHETLEIKGNEELISHYNNQYDPLYGFLRQYLLTQNSKWLELANDLADHVKNIDTYHTTLDKVEYNGGLFWHTDHYLPAETASHRTYSKHQLANAYQDHAGGGGPGGQHCYTTGLMLHYCLTGDLTSKQAVLQLTNWITHVYEGSGTLTDLLLAIKNKHRIDIKNAFTGQYPLDRGTGHYIIALIDAFELTNKQSFLDQASLIIKNTVHPKDDVKARNLENIEECWYYTVFFQAVYRYLLTKEHNNQLDTSFSYAQNSLLQYANWMVEHEQPYLNTPEVLEYPNHTWAAQDIRKANVLFMAAYFSVDKKQQTQHYEKAEEIYSYVVTTLLKEPTSSFTRILSILMQNHGVKSYVENFNFSGDLKRSDNDFSLATLDYRLLHTFWNTLYKTSLMNELTWLRKRSTQIDHLLQKLGK